MTYTPALGIIFEAAQKQDAARDRRQRSRSGASDGAGVSAEAESAAPVLTVFWQIVLKQLIIAR